MIAIAWSQFFFVSVGQPKDGMVPTEVPVVGIVNQHKNVSHLNSVFSNSFFLFDSTCHASFFLFNLLNPPFLPNIGSFTIFSCFSSSYQTPSWLVLKTDNFYLHRTVRQVNRQQINILLISILVMWSCWLAMLWIRWVPYTAPFEMSVPPNNTLLHHKYLYCNVLYIVSVGRGGLVCIQEECHWLLKYTDV